ncbi:amphi-Trp domain-containing protein [Streptomyces sp. E5N91]|uniref:amphi-Trp domain-containing protein n=1 Tax=Streptomyces sp. E5N91 TaxID=1851996 RepID=UPI000EF5F0A2|nr:amphi-Trp domain-containing protein [Streptomyces sp. E5N91]
MDLEFGLKRSLSRLEVAEQLTALAAVLREGGDAETELSPGTLSLRVPDDLRSEIEVEIGDGEIELVIELKWPTPTPRTEPSRAEPGRSSTGAKGSGSANLAVSVGIAGRLSEVV